MKNFNNIEHNIDEASQIIKDAIINVSNARKVVDVYNPRKHKFDRASSIIRQYLRKSINDADKASDILLRTFVSVPSD